MIKLTKEMISALLKVKEAAGEDIFMNSNVTIKTDPNNAENFGIMLDNIDEEPDDVKEDYLTKALNKDKIEEDMSYEELAQAHAEAGNYVLSYLNTALYASTILGSKAKLLLKKLPQDKSLSELSEKTLNKMVNTLTSIDNIRDTLKESLIGYKEHSLAFKEAAPNVYKDVIIPAYKEIDMLFTQIKVNTQKDRTRFYETEEVKFYARNVLALANLCKATLENIPQVGFINDSVEEEEENTTPSEPEEDNTPTSRNALCEHLMEMGKKAIDADDDLTVLANVLAIKANFERIKELSDAFFAYKDKYKDLFDEKNQDIQIESIQQVNAKFYKAAKELLSGLDIYKDGVNASFKVQPQFSAYFLKNTLDQVSKLNKATCDICNALTDFEHQSLYRSSNLNIAAHSDILSTIHRFICFNEALINKLPMFKL